MNEEDLFFGEFNHFNSLKISNEKSEEDENTEYINMTTKLDEINRIILLKPNLKYFRMNPIYKSGLKGEYDEFVLKYNLENDSIITNNNTNSNQSNDVNKEMRLIYTYKFIEGYRPGGECPDFGSKPMKPKKYDGKTKITFPVYVQPKFRGLRILFSPSSILFEKIIDANHRTELMNFFSYIPHNCLLDMIIYSQNKYPKDIEKLLKEKRYNEITFVICDYYSFIIEDYHERFNNLISAYQNYIHDYDLSEPFSSFVSRFDNPNKSSIIISPNYIANSLQDIEKYRENLSVFGVDFEKIMIKKLKYGSNKLEYKCGTTARILTY